MNGQPFDPLAPLPPELEESIKKSRTPTGERPVVKAELRRELNLNEIKTVAAIVFASIATVSGVFFTLEARGQTYAKQEVAPVADQTKQNTADIKDLKTAVQQSALTTARIEVMVEMSLKGQGIRPPPKVVLDGGQ